MFNKKKKKGGRNPKPVQRSKSCTERNQSKEKKTEPKKNKNKNPQKHNTSQKINF